MLVEQHTPAEVNETNLRGKICKFVHSEEGKVGIKSPLTLGVATDGILLSQAIIGTPDADAGLCQKREDCMPPEACRGSFVAGVGTCY